jgi:hypothetical protein
MDVDGYWPKQEPFFVTPKDRKVMLEKLETWKI